MVNADDYDTIDDLLDTTKRELAIVRDALYSYQQAVKGYLNMAQPLAIVDWNDAVSAVYGCPGPPPAEVIDRLIQTGDQLKYLVYMHGGV